VIISIDVGLKRIGVAMSPDGRLSIPQKAIIRRGRKQASEEVSNLLKDLNCKTLIVGLPIGGESEEEMGRRVRHFVSLIDTGGVEIYYQDESHSSLEAKEIMRGSIKQKRDGRVDSISASIILKRWLNSQLKEDKSTQNR
jgi:putative Holliday junction resolvase